MKRHGKKLVLTAIGLVLFYYTLIFGIGPIVRFFERDRVNQKALTALEQATLTPAKVADVSQGWPQWRGPNRDGVAPAGPFRTDWKTNPPKLLWSAPCGGGFSQPLVVGQRLYLHDYANGTERLRCLNAKTGEVKWEHAEPVDYSGFKLGYGSGPRATPTFHFNLIYTVGATGVMTCLLIPEEEGQPPKVIWKKDLLTQFKAPMPTWGVASSPLIVETDKSVVVQPGGKDGSVVGFDERTGDLLWAVGSSPSGYSSPILTTHGTQRQIVAVTGDSIQTILSDGRELWDRRWVTPHNGNIATPVAVGDYVFVSSNYGKGCVLLRFDTWPPPSVGTKPTEVYFRKNRVMSNHHSTCVYRDGYLYGFDGNELACVDFKKGERVPDWHAADDEGRELAKGSLTLVGENLLGLTESGTLFLGSASPTGFTFLGQVKNALGSRECWAAPVVVDGRVYLRDGEKVVCYDVR